MFSARRVKISACVTVASSCVKLRPHPTFLAGGFGQQPGVSISRQHAWINHPPDRACTLRRHFQQLLLAAAVSRLLLSGPALLAGCHSAAGCGGWPVPPTLGCLSCQQQLRRLPHRPLGSGRSAADELLQVPGRRRGAAVGRIWVPLRARSARSGSRPDVAGALSTTTAR